MSLGGEEGTKCWEKHLERAGAAGSRRDGALKPALPAGGGGAVCQALPWEPSVNRGRLMPWATAARRLFYLHHSKAEAIAFSRVAGSAVHLFVGSRAGCVKGITFIFSSV